MLVLYTLLRGLRLCLSWIGKCAENRRTANTAIQSSFHDNISWKLEHYLLEHLQCISRFMYVHSKCLIMKLHIESIIFFLYLVSFLKIKTPHATIKNLIPSHLKFVILLKYLRGKMWLIKKHLHNYSS